MNIYGQNWIKIWESNDVELYGVTIGNYLRFNKQASNVRLKVKLSALKAVAKFVPFKKSLILFKAFIESLFKYCLHGWMFHGRQITLRKQL